MEVPIAELSPPHSTVLGLYRMDAPWHCRYGFVMTAHVDAYPIEPHGWILSSWDRAIPTRFGAATVIDGFDVTITAITGARGPMAVSVTVDQPRGGLGPGVTLAMLRKVTVDQIIKQAVGQLARPAASAEAETGIRGTYRVQGVDAIFGSNGATGHIQGRGRDTPPERLANVVRVYNAAVAAGRAPVKAVKDELFLSRSNASRLVSQARKAGLLAPTTPGKVSDAPAPEYEPEPPWRIDPGPTLFIDPEARWPGEEEQEEQGGGADGEGHQD